MQADLARLRVLVVGVGTVGLDLAIRLVQAGIQHVSVMDFDTVEILNLDRLITATRLDAALFRSKAYVALRACGLPRPPNPGAAGVRAQRLRTGRAPHRARL